MNYYDSKTIVHNECSCLHVNDVDSSDCLKRTYWVNDLDNNQSVRFKICNEHLRLLIRKDIIGVCDAYKSQPLVDVISQYIELERGRVNHNTTFQQRNDIWNSYITTELVQRPFHPRYVSMEYALLHVIKYKNSVLKERVINTFRHYFTKDLFKKYKSKYKEALRLLNKLDKSWLEDEREIILNDLIVSILQLNIKTRVL